jgi:hypothetical protein
MGWDGNVNFPEGKIVPGWDGMGMSIFLKEKSFLDGMGRECQFFLKENRSLHRNPHINPTYRTIRLLCRDPSGYTRRVKRVSAR